LQGTVHCEEKQRLLDLYKSAMAHYSAALNDVAVTRGKTTQPEYNRLLSLSEKAWIATEASRLALERHTQKHGC
jgi:hypothetical protein